MAHHHTRSRARTWGRRLLGLVLAAAIVAAAMGPGSATGATGSVVVTADVPSAISLTNNCEGAAATRFGVVQPGSSATTSTGLGRCNVAWTSSNDTSMLRIAQRDGTGTAMSRPATFATNIGWSLFTAVDTADGTNLVAVGSGGTFARSPDGGATWNLSGGIGGSGNEVTDVEQVPGTPATAWIVGYGLRVQQVTNALTAPAATSRVGNLVAQGWPATVDPLAVAVLNSSTVFIAGSGGWFAKTIDTGTTWTVYQLPSVTGTGNLTISPTGDLWAATSGDPAGNLWRTTAATGATPASWTRFPIGGGGAGMRSTSMPDATHGYAVGPSGQLYTWNGSSFTWRGNSLLEPHGFASVASLPSTPTTAVAVGEEGAIVQTTDNGVTWVRRPSRTTDDLAFVRASSGGYVAVGDARTTTSSPDGASWTFRSDDAPARARRGTAAQPVDGRIVLQVGSRGSIWRSTDGGATFGAVPSGTTEGLIDVTFASSTIAWAVGDIGTVLRSTDAGLTWGTVNAGTSARLRGVAAGAAEQVVAVGDGGTVVVTRNGGTTWASQTVLGGQQLNAVSMGSRLVGVIAGSDALRRTDDGGQTWLAPTSQPGTAWHASVSMANASIGFTTNDWGGVWRTADGGATWLSSTVASGYPRRVSAASSSVVYAALQQDLYQSADGGVTWTLQYSAPEQLRSVAAVDASSVVMGGEHGGTHARSESAVAAARIPDYGAAPNSWATSAQAMFGVCVQAIGAQTSMVAPWASAGGTCSASDTNPWRALPASATKVASVTTAGNSGSVDLVWGVRFPATQAPGDYSAGVVFEALAPDA